MANPDRAPHVDVLAVTRTANALSVSEFQIFEAAYSAWYREQAQVAMLERHFAVYLFEGTVPVWVRQYTRTVTEQVARAQSAPLCGLWRGLGLAALFQLPLSSGEPSAGTLIA